MFMVGLNLIVEADYIYAVISVSDMCDWLKTDNSDASTA